MTNRLAPDDLPRLRAGIDGLDQRLVALLLAERARLVEGISAYEQRHHVPVVGRQREDGMLDRVARLAKEGGASTPGSPNRCRGR